jgi:diadenosine tetraphosphatase ApaH/serine/threonine PP2A family protein phosphatase
MVSALFTFHKLRITLQGQSPSIIQTSGQNVRILIISDIHANLQALEAALEAAPEHDLVVNLGDVVGYGANPNEAIKISQSLGKIFVRGNHDKAAAGIVDAKDFNPIAAEAIQWTRTALTPENRDWLKSLPHGPIRLPNELDVQFVHGSPRDEDEYLIYGREGHEVLESVSVLLTFFGHTHLQGLFLSGEDSARFCLVSYQTTKKSEKFEFELAPGKKYLINPGSIGQPRDGDWRAAFALYDSTLRLVTFFRVPYDLKGAQREIMTANLPRRLAERLAEGR